MPAFSKIHIVYLTVLYFTALLPHSAFALQASPQTQLAKVYEENTSIPISDYLVSEKYDGIRAIWTGSKLLTRQGNQISAPEWFTAPLPDIWLDGELWTKRQSFEALSSIVRTQIPEEERWREVQYMVFDMPDSQRPFEERYKNYSNLIEKMNIEHIKAVKQQRFHSNHELSEHLQAMVERGAEGLMLHLATALHQSGRSDALLKLKPYFDEEAEVIAHLPGKGKYTDMLGALRVRNQQGIEFSIGTGFTDAERANPPPVGSIITYKYHGYTNNGVPRFASFLRIREELEDE
ncbi:DNA ligase [Idiomarina zobellii]|uniref:DNA ligase n=1 Tax=Idiomarina zobellii TaxID=86103 RepID=A0A837NC42_9GAMM|nr:DNA ligase [Idiomarina zobellii]KPD23423.1 DNA ligase [Idiomarina zobellii]SDG03892.1 DNA ligase-1 [Idiomarina zobellii]